MPVSRSRSMCVRWRVLAISSRVVTTRSGSFTPMGSRRVGKAGVARDPAGSLAPLSRISPWSVPGAPVPGASVTIEVAAATGVPGPRSGSADRATRCGALRTAALGPNRWRCGGKPPRPERAAVSAALPILSRAKPALGETHDRPGRSDLRESVHDSETSAVEALAAPLAAPRSHQRRLDGPRDRFGGRRGVVDRLEGGGQARRQLPHGRVAVDLPDLEVVARPAVVDAAEVQPGQLEHLLDPALVGVAVEVLELLGLERRVHRRRVQRA